MVGVNVGGVCVVGDGGLGLRKVHLGQFKSDVTS